MNDEIEVAKKNIKRLMTSNLVLKILLTILAACMIYTYVYGTRGCSSQMSIVEVNLSSNFPSENSLRDYNSPSTTSNLPQNSKSANSSGEVILSIGITVIAIICTIIFILKYKKSLNVEVDESNFDKILKLEKRNVIVFNILLIIGIILRFVVWGYDI